MRRSTTSRRSVKRIGISRRRAASPAADAGGDESPALRRALQRLPPGHRQVLLLSEIGGFSTREIAGMLGIPEGTVGSRKHAALAQLRNHLEQIP